MARFPSIAAVMLAVLFLICGNGLIGTLIPVRAAYEHFTPLTIGLIGSCYFGGMLVGTTSAPWLIRQIGLVRSFCTFVTLGIIAVLTLPAILHPAAWLVLRALLGFAFAGLYGVIDAWVVLESHSGNRGRLYGLYQFINYTGSAIGVQLLLLAPPNSFELFNLVAGLFALASLPLLFTVVREPQTVSVGHLQLLWLCKASPIGALGAFLVGAANGNFWSLAPIYGLGMGIGTAGVSLFLTAAILGTAVSVWPVGHISDSFDRRILIIIAASLGAVTEAALWAQIFTSPVHVAVLGALLGATAMPLYTLIVAHTNDRTGRERAVMTASALLFLYCLGAILTPPIVAQLMKSWGDNWLFGVNFGLHLPLAAFALIRMLLQRRAPNSLIDTLTPPLQ